MRSPGLALAAATVLALEGVALTIFAVIDLAGLGAGDAASVPTALALTVLTAIGAIALFIFAVGVRRGRSWARSGGTVFQVLAIALALASLSVTPVPWFFIVAVGGPAAIGLGLILASARAEYGAESAQGSGVDSEELS